MLKLLIKFGGKKSKQSSLNIFVRGNRRNKQPRTSLNHLSVRGARGYEKKKEKGQERGHTCCKSALGAFEWAWGHFTSHPGVLFTQSVYKQTRWTTTTQKDFNQHPLPDIIHVIHFGKCKLLSRVVLLYCREFASGLPQSACSSATPHRIFLLNHVISGRDASVTHDGTEVSKSFSNV